MITLTRNTTEPGTRHSGSLPGVGTVFIYYLCVLFGLFLTFYPSFCVSQVPDSVFEFYIIIINRSDAFWVEAKLVGEFEGPVQKRSCSTRRWRCRSRAPFRKQNTTSKECVSSKSDLIIYRLKFIYTCTHQITHTTRAAPCTAARTTRAAPFARPSYSCLCPRPSTCLCAKHLAHQLRLHPERVTKHRE